jgi:hypothetical protein
MHSGLCNVSGAFKTVTRQYAHGRFHQCVPANTALENLLVNCVATCQHWSVCALPDSPLIRPDAVLGGLGGGADR